MLAVVVVVVVAEGVEQAGLESPEGHPGPVFSTSTSKPALKRTPLGSELRVAVQARERWSRELQGR